MTSYLYWSCTIPDLYNEVINYCVLNSCTPCSVQTASVCFYYSSNAGYALSLQMLTIIILLSLRSAE